MGKSEDTNKPKTEEQEKADLLYRAQLESLVNEDKSMRKRFGLDEIPMHKMIEQVNYIDKNLLPAIKKKSGEKSPDYIFFTDVIKSLLWAVMLSDRFDMLDRRVGLLNMEKSILRDHLTIFERELTKYHAMEDIYLTDALDHYKRGVVKRAADLLDELEKNKKSL